MGQLSQTEDGIFETEAVYIWLSEEDIPRREKLRATKEIALYRSKYTLLLITGGKYVLC